MAERSVRDREVNGFKSLHPDDVRQKVQTAVVVARKRCCDCRKLLPLHRFHRRGDGKQSACATCKKLRDQLRYAAKGSLVREQKRLRKRKLIAWYQALKDAPCTDCHEVFHPAAMQWDHRDAPKLGEVATMLHRVSREVLLRELAKCQLVCANCHAIRTYRRKDAGREDLRNL